MKRFQHWLDRAIEALIGSTKWLCLAIVALLFLQWPLRDLRSPPA